MLLLTGRVRGISYLEFVPVGVKRLTVEAVDPTLGSARCAPDSTGAFSLTLYSSAEVAGAWDDGWCWRCTEHAVDRSSFAFAFKAVTGTFRYADIRPLGGGLQ